MARLCIECSCREAIDGCGFCSSYCAELAESRRRRYRPSPSAIEYARMLERTIELKIRREAILNVSTRVVL